MRDPANEEAIDWARRNLLLFPTDDRTFRDDPIEREDIPTGYTPLMPVAAPQPHPAPEEDHRTASSVGAETIIWEDIL